MIKFNQCIKSILRATCLTWLLLLCAYTSMSQTSVPSDTVPLHKEIDLQEITVESARSGKLSKFDSDGAVTVDAVTAGQRMRVFGEADAMMVLNTMPGVSAGSDYASGVSVEGGEFSHTFYGIGGAPVFFPYHFGGIFSVFNAEHFPMVRMEKSIHGADMPDYLGGRIDFSQGKRLTRHTRGTVNLGLIAASATVSTPVGEKADITASGRISYLNLIYGKLLHDNHTDIGYGFHDLNLSARLDLTEKDRLSLNVFYNRDYLTTDDGKYALGAQFRWRNILGSCEWRHSGDRFKWNQTLYSSLFGSSFNMSMTDIKADVNSSIVQTGTRGNGSITFGKTENVKFIFGGEAIYTSSSPQKIAIIGYGDGSSPSCVREHSLTTGVNTAVELHFTPTMSLLAGERTGLYLTCGYHSVYLDPFVTFGWQTRAGSFALHWGGYTQPLQQVGFSDIGLASNFWFAARKSLPIQRSKTFSVSWVHRPGKGEYEISADAYYKILSNVSEFDGTIITMLNSDYDCYDHILSGSGRNYGAGIMGSRVAGKLTGSLSSSWGRALRRFPALGERWFTASVEQRFGCTFQLNYKVNRAVALNAIWNYATGRPITPVEALYMVGENVVSVYGERNSRTLPPYHRLDLSASWNFKLRFLPHVYNSIVLSVINAYGHRNVSMVVFGYDAGKGVFSRRDIYSLYRFLPSVSYTVRF